MTAQRPKTTSDPLTDLIRTQRGLVTKSQAHALGMSSSAISRRVNSGRWERLLTGVYRSAEVPVNWEQAVLAACLAGGLGSAASHACAAALHGLDEIPRGVLEIWTSRRLRGGQLLCHIARLPETDVTRVSGIPVTTVERTMLDLASVMDRDHLELVPDSALRQRKTSIARMRWRLQHVPPHGAKGVGKLRELVDERSVTSPISESALEVRLAQLIRRAGLPPPQTQFRVLEGNRFVGRFDFAYPEAKLIIEVDGYRWHSGNQAWQRDRKRDNILNRLGWTILRFTADDLKDRAGVVSQISEILRPSLGF